ncbi:DNA primase [Phreatobacter oligotrophus]|jgi:DNA primase|uniref:DNA primase n=1 Tax=Phreatobacter oligotrophus TaxID=1122261 RepID=UPI0023520405|nr:DNA primase [Phreatobacter oligotrophus]MBX9990555.1 DNA primase [Phreatobacter oligotrophus]
MRFPPSFLDEIRQRLPVSEVVGRRVKLKKQGREWRGLSPFNAEKTPSFYVNDQKGFYHCFSSGKHGDQFRFLMETEGLSFPEAVERLASDAGLAMPKVSAEEVQRAEKARTLYDVMELAAQYFQAMLQDRVGAKARGYLAGRDLGAPTQLKFRLGYAPGERFGLKEHLGSKGVSVPDMIAAGLLVHGDDIPVPYDRFRDRVMFPITDLRGRVVAFGGRALEKDVPAKYLNSPETDLFHKGSLLYNAHGAREVSHRSNRIIAVEGYVDVIAMVMAGFGETVAPLGTALTEGQLDLLWKMAPEPVLLFDGDKAGRRAAYRAIDIALPLLKPGRSLLFAALPEGQDPDDLIRSSGREAMDAVLAQAQPLAAMLWQRETEAGVFGTPEKRAALEARFAEVVATIGDENVRRHYRDDVFGRLSDLFRPMQRARRQGGPGQQGRSGQAGGFGGRGFSPYGVPDHRPSPSLAASALVRGPRAALPMREALILTALLNHPWLIDGQEEEIAGLDLRHPQAEALKTVLLEMHAEGIDGEAEAFHQALIAAGHGPLVDQLRATVSLGAVWGAMPGAAKSDAEVTFGQLMALHRKKQALIKEIRDAERAFGDDPTEANEQWLLDAKRRESELAGTEALVEGFGAQSGRGGRSV